MEIFNRKLISIFSTLLLMCIPLISHAQVDCDKTNNIVGLLSFVGNDIEAEERRSIKDFLLKPDDLMLECIYLQEYKINQSTRKPALKIPFQPFTDKFTPSPFNTNFENCQKSQCSYHPAIQTLLMTVCREDLDKIQDKETCNHLDKPATVINNHYERKPLPTWRRVVGGIAIGLGAGTAILGAVHLGIPVFSSSGGCTEYGLDYPCLTASRFGAGFSLLGVGLVVAGGGIFALAWPTGESLNKVKSP